ncbi:hypothetical protein EJB05_48297 [Eragrostis curvula]|uniref:Uncharacterized protein n=1 Tax=Eragrostis curvula TaxID=38414 RepID=A0A5J9T1G8_9POAL|nr:hypothetical protein EJB05_48297 [Eragrostis curvula]
MSPPDFVSSAFETNRVRPTLATGSVCLSAVPVALALIGSSFAGGTLTPRRQGPMDLGALRLVPGPLSSPATVLFHSVPWVLPWSPAPCIRWRPGARRTGRYLRHSSPCRSAARWRRGDLSMPPRRHRLLEFAPCELCRRRACPPRSVHRQWCPGIMVGSYRCSWYPGCANGWWIWCCSIHVVSFGCDNQYVRRVDQSNGVAADGVRAEVSRSCHMRCMLVSVMESLESPTDPVFVC